MLRVIDQPGAGVVEDLDEVCRRLRTGNNESGSIELSRLDGAWPMLSILTNGAWCVLHLTPTKAGPLLTLEGESPDDAPEQLEFVYAGMPTVFTREYLNPMVRAVQIVRAFAINAAWPATAKFVEL